MTGRDQRDSPDYPDLLVQLHEAVVAGEVPPHGSSEIVEATRQQDQELARRLAGAEACLRLLERVRREEPPGPQADLAVPERLGRFQVQKLLGQGTYGLVYLAYDPELQRLVAIKIPRPEVILSRSLRDRFLREAEAAAALDHPHIVPVYEAGQSGGIYYTVMAYCPGRTLSEWLRERAELPEPAEAARLVALLADAVAHAHSRGILHRDLKPSNVLLAAKTAVETGADDHAGGPPARSATLSAAQIADFGLAKYLDEDSTQTGTTAIVGTPSYMAPEQAAGNNSQIGTATDIYALGAILFELLTGRAPFVAPSVMATLAAVQSEPAPRLCAIRGEVPLDLEAICLKCLEKEPASRYRSAAELSDDLGRFLRRELVYARPAGGLERTARWCRRNPMLAGLSAAVLLLSLVLVAGSVGATIWLAQAHQRTLASLAAETAAKDQATRSEEQALRAEFEARVAEASASRHSGLPRSRTQALTALAHAAAHRDRLNLADAEVLRLRNEAIAAMSLIDLRWDCQWPGNPPRYPGPSTSFDGQVQRYARMEPNGKIALRDLRDNALLLQVDGLGDVERKPYTQFSPNGRYLAVRGINAARQLRLQLWDLQQPDRPLFDQPAGGEWSSRSLDFSADSQRLAYVGLSGTIQLFGIKSRQLAQTIELGWSPGWLRFDPSGSQLATVNERKNSVVFVSVASGRTAGPTLQHATTVTDLAWNPISELVAVAGEDGRIYLWDSTTGKALATCQGHYGTVHHVAFHPAGDLLMTSGWGSTILWEPLSGRALVKSGERGVRFSADGRWLASAVPGVMAGRWEVAPRREYYTLSGHLRAAFVYAMAWHPQGRLMASMAAGDGLRLWDTQRRREVAHLNFSGSSVAFSADESSLLVGGNGQAAFRVPIVTMETGEEELVQLGAPERLYSQGWNNANVSFSADCRTLATSVNSSTMVVVDLDEPARPRVEIAGSGLRFHDLSPDGQLLAIGNWNGTSCSVHDARTGTLIKELSNSGSARVRFSWDGRWLASSGYDLCTVWDTRTWEPRYRVEHQGSSYAVAAFSPDNRMIAVTAAGSVILVDLSDGREIATLYPPGDLQAKSISFSPDGRQLAVGTRGHAINVWELGYLRDQLQQLDLDWPHPPLPSRLENARPIKVTMDQVARVQLEGQAWSKATEADIEKFTALMDSQGASAELLWKRGRCYLHLRQLDDAVADFDRALQLQPENQHVHFWRGHTLMLTDRLDEALENLRFSYSVRPDDYWCLRHMAWILVGGPPELRDAEEARRLAEHAMRCSHATKPENLALCKAVLAMALYRLNDYDTAVKLLDEAIDAGVVNTRILLFKSMCHCVQGDYESARLFYDEAVLRIEQQVREDALGNPKFIHVEAEQMLLSAG